MKETVKAVVNEVKGVLDQVDEQQAIALGREIIKANRIFITGEGRSGLMGKAVAMRLVHAGFTVYVTGETITPSIQSGDLLLAISGSGSTEGSYQYARTAKKMDARVFLVTTAEESTIGEVSDGVLIFPAATKFRKSHEPDTIQPLGNQFDQSVHLLLDAVIIWVTRQTAGSEDVNQQMASRHANLE
ncbi:6-phospho-3-hexuloisomerase [Salisediminibacterium beveridgei]|uniref:3-hexulose-6-phosphate isomerase n=1 Tax=Salisediminibacterium beveridgei TaxID=632773 RepID=A0A1D7QRJ8_9BACI|nr:6-phospho-3-hexuloisomerase [Salisediminibacterium beveridgei]AOM81636.1 3-hexulose-6-phosphate isomerase [Salisediminibacterium beveridgei]